MGKKRLHTRLLKFPVCLAMLQFVTRVRLLYAAGAEAKYLCIAFPFSLFHVGQAVACDSFFSAKILPE